MQSEVKICKDCEHCKWHPYSDHRYCKRDDKRQEVTNLITGEVEVVGRVRKCNDERDAGWLSARLFGLCGKEGRFFAKKNTESK